MSKETLNLSIEKSLKQRAKTIARKRGISISRFFEELITREKMPDIFTPDPGSAAEQFMNAIPDSKKVDDYDYKKLKEDMIKERYER